MLNDAGISVFCGVASGTFMSEYIVKIEDKGETLWQGAVDKEMVFDLRKAPQEGKFVEGRVYGYLISFDQNSAIVELPVENVGGRRVCVPLGMVRKEKVPA